MFCRLSRSGIRTVADLGDGVLPSRCSAAGLRDSRLGRLLGTACGFSAIQMRGLSDGAPLWGGQPPCMDAAPIDQAIALASGMLLMVLAGLAKGRLEWHPRPPFWRRWRR